ncbi:universal stress protein [Flavobacteriaceae bacterium KMM 6897]|nr:universal stress protein [Flavobacteriaceae bacterium KMM 6897]MEB8344864.1 universal stress protein [Flavobacteriaceae bacterium KMM 6898]
MKNILIPTDFSEDSFNAVTYALELLKKSPCNFYLLHVNDMSGYAFQGLSYAASPEIIVEDVIVSARKKLHIFLKRVESLATTKKHHFYPLYEQGFFVECVRRTVQERKIDLIVMGTKGTSGALGDAIGSNTGDVITKVKCNTLAVPAMVGFGKLEEIAFPTDYNIFFSAKILSAISELLETNKAYMRVMHASKSDQMLSDSQLQNKEYLEDYLNETFENMNSFHSISNKNVTAAVQCFVESRNVDLLVMVAKNLNFIQQILFSSKVEKISFHTKVPFLVIHD